MIESLGSLMQGLAVAISPMNILYCFIGCAVGMLVGVLPGISPTKPPHY